MKRKKKIKCTTKVTLIWCCIMLMILTCGLLDLYFYSKVEKSVWQQTYQDLREDNDTALSSMKNMLHSKLEWMKVVAKFCDVPEGSGDENWREMVRELQYDSGQFGIADSLGQVYYGDSKVQHIIDRPYFKEVMKGNPGISRVLENDLIGMDGVVLAVPIEREGKVQGAVCIEYTTMELGSYINDEKMNQYGANLIFDGEGKLAASYPGMEAFDTVYDMLDTMEYKETGAVETMRSAVNRGESGYLAYYHNGKMRLLYYQPAGIRDWNILSLVVMDSYEGIFREIRYLSVLLTAGALVVSLVIIVLIFCAIRLRRHEMEEVEVDPLTGVLNRSAARKYVEKQLRKNGKRNFSACLFLDVDNFKEINDTYGHDKGDEVLMMVGHILKKCTRSQDVVSRFGGDEFCVWIYGESGRGTVETIAQRIVDTMKIMTHISMGVTMLGEEDRDYDIILKRADEALYEAKKKGKNRFVIM